MTLQQVVDHLQQLSANLSRLSEQLVAVKNHFPSSSTLGSTPSQTSSPRERFIPVSARYSGDLGTCAQFLLQCTLVFNQQPSNYPTTQSKTAFIISLLSGQVATWVLAITEQESELLMDCKQSTEEIK